MVIRLTAYDLILSETLIRAEQFRVDYKRQMVCELFTSPHERVIVTMLGPSLAKGFEIRDDSRRSE